MSSHLTERLAGVYELAPHDPSRSYTMEGMRGFAVLLVFGVHFTAIYDAWSRGPLTQGLADVVYGIGHSGVDLFFVLSGYLIYGGVIRRALHYPTYMRRRLRRIYPTFFAVFCLYVVLSLLVPAESKIPDGAVPAALYLGANLLLLPGIFEIPPLNVVTWSLSFEVFYYLTIPLVVGVLAMRRWASPWRVTFFVALGTMWFVHCLDRESLRTRLIMFVSGIVVYEVLHRRESRAPARVSAEWGALAVLVSGLALAFVFDPGYLKPAILPQLGGPVGNALHVLTLAVTFGIFVSIALRAAGRGPLNVLLSARPLRWWGNMSYSYYLIHSLTIQFVFLVAGRLLPERFHGDAAFWVMSVVTLVATWVVATVLFLVVEKPVSLTVPPRPPLGVGRWRPLHRGDYAPPLQVDDVEPTPETSSQPEASAASGGQTPRPTVPTGRPEGSPATVRQAAHGAGVLRTRSSGRATARPRRR